MNCGKFFVMGAFLLRLIFWKGEEQTEEDGETLYNVDIKSYYFSLQDINC